MTIDYDVNAYYENMNSNYNDYMDYEILELAEKMASAIKKRTGKKIKEWTFEYKALADIAETIIATGTKELNLDRYDISCIDLDAIQLQAAISEAVKEYKRLVS